MTYPHDHTPEEHRHALGDLARDICLHMELCQCGESMEYLPAYKAEPDTGTAAWPGGWVCGGCGAERPDVWSDRDEWGEAA